MECKKRKEEILKPRPRKPDAERAMQEGLTGKGANEVGGHIGQSAMEGKTYLELG